MNVNYAKEILKGNFRASEFERISEEDSYSRVYVNNIQVANMYKDDLGIFGIVFYVDIDSELKEQVENKLKLN